MLWRGRGLYVSFSGNHTYWLIGQYSWNPSRLSP